MTGFCGAIPCAAHLADFPPSAQCDERHPRCGNCVKHGVSCDFDASPSVDRDIPVAAETPVTPSIISTPASAPSPCRPSPSCQPSPSLQPLVPTTPRLVPRAVSVSSTPPTVDRFMELRLLHHFTTTTSKTLFTRPPSTQDVWQHAVPSIAFEGRSYLMDAILSVAALHLRFQHPRDAALARASHAYTASALAEYCAALDSGITAHNAEALFLTASLIAFQSTASRIFAKDDADADADGDASAPPSAATSTTTTTTTTSRRYALPMPWFHAFQGVKTVVATSWQWIRHSAIVKAVIDSQPSFQLDLNPLGPASFFGHLLDGLDDELAAEPPARVSATSQGYSHAVSVLNWAHKNAHAPAALAFPASVSRRFLELVEERRPRALAILACFFALLKRMDGVWWLHDVARREVTGIVGMLEPGSSWWRHLEWPVRISVWDGSDIPPDVWGVRVEAPQPGAAGAGGVAETMMSHIELVTSQSRRRVVSGSPEAASSLPGGAEYGLTVAPLD